MTAQPPDRLTAPTSRQRLGFALALFALSLALLIPSMAPTVTLWDAGEFLAASKVAGIPHPPGTPLWVMLAHSWATLIPFGSWATRVILMTAVAGAAATACLGLVAWEGLRRVPALATGDLPNWFVPAAAGAAAIAGSFTFTNWQNSNETEVYAIAMLVIAIVLWLLHRWREQRGTPQADRTLLLILYLLGLSIGNHLLALLVGPAVVAFLYFTGRAEPVADPSERSRELATTAVMAGSWFLLIGLGLGSTMLSVVGTLAFLGAALWALTHRRAAFVGTALVVALIGITTYLFMYIRAGQHPMINEALPDNWHSLLDVIRRKQYPVRTPFDDPTVMHGPGNPGRSPLIILLQLVNYFQYFFWQWGYTFGDSWQRIPFAALYGLLGLVGCVAHRRADKPAWGMLMVLVLTTGLGLMAYMNFKPGFSLGYNWFPNFANHEVRERDYFFVVSFVVWGMWAGRGIALFAARAARALRSQAPGPRSLVAGAVLSAAVLLPIGSNWGAATRTRPPIAMLAHDVAYDLLNSMPPYGILITYGDNDTFPLWYAQEVEGIRPDVTVVCLALAQTDWYVKELRDQPTRPFVDSAAAPAWRGRGGPVPAGPLHTMTDAEIASVAGVLHPVQQNTPVQLGAITHMIPAGAVLAPNDIAILRIIQQNLGKRPIGWATTAGRNFIGLDQYILQRGMVYTLSPVPLDSTDVRYGSRGEGGVLIDLPATMRLTDEVYRWSGLDSVTDRPDMEPSAEGLADNMAQPVILLALGLEAHGDGTNALKYLDLAARLRPDPALKAAADQLRQQLLTDSARH